MKFSEFDLEALVVSMAGSNLAEQLVSMARTAENCERYEDMCCYIKARVEKFPEQPLSVEERNLLSVAYKNVIGARRSSWRALVAELSDLNGDESFSSSVELYKGMIEKELSEISNDIINLLENILIKNLKDPNPEEPVFYLKMAGDYYRYLTESVSGEENKQNTQKYYQRAFEAADALEPTHPIRLGLALNYSVCKFEIMKEKDAACEMAKTAFDHAISKLDQLNEADYKDSTLIMQLLRDNLTLWSNTDEAEEE